ncbi:hypothetical protein IU470_30235 [Nocardia abscessus]|uniref:CopG family transcriptional regulator n=1 Tax=Nocardia abscessus TaxID=120957 RepID=A0ABS0CG89_9NOCA|nr:hypothetical protein [Nocardia abscessus]MBF6229357.1 hypothetical protein [Nocardia abscessus]
MSHTRDDAADAVYRELVDAFGEDWSIDDFRPDPDAGPVEVERPEQPGELIVTRTVELHIPLSIEQRLTARAEAAEASVDELVSEWVTAEAAADDTISRDEILALLARRHRRSA